MPHLVKEKIGLIEDKSKLVLINNFDNKDVASLCNGAKNDGAEVFDFPDNLGIAGSWNFGLKRLETDCDFVVILSTSICFDKPFEFLIDTVIEHEEKEPAGLYLCDGVTNKHCFVVTRKGLEIGGYFDENFWPSYYEDIDYSYRSSLNGFVPIRFDELKIAHSHGASLALCGDSRLLMHHQLNANRMLSYYIAKWGGYQNQEIYKIPFNNPKMGINDWVVERNDEWIPLPRVK